MVREMRDRTFSQPSHYPQEILGIHLWEKQEEIVESVLRHEKTLVYSCISSGKSFCAAAIIPMWLHLFYPNGRVFTIAPTERQLEVNLWGEFSKIYANSKMPLGGELLMLDWKLDRNCYAKGFKPANALNIFGIHGPHDLFIVDDGQGLDPLVIDAMENAFAGGTAKMLFLCNPTMNSGLVYECITAKRALFHCIKIDAYDTPNVRSGSLIVPGLVTREKVLEWEREYGRESDWFRVKVLALPPKQEPDTLIPLDWIELATCREASAYAPVVMGVDVARFGDDDTVICIKDGRHIRPVITVLHGNDTMQVTGMIAKMARDNAVEEIYVDEIGVGAGVVDRLAELKFNVYGINVGEKAGDEERFVNLRSEMWWATRESLDPKNPGAMCIPKHDRLMADLSSLKWMTDSSGRVKIEPKEDTKERLGRSPDVGDAYALAVYRSYCQRVKPSAAFTVGNLVMGNPRPDWL